MDEVTENEFPRSQTLIIADFSDLPKNYADAINVEIKEFNSFLRQIGITKKSNPNFVYAVETIIKMLLHSIPVINYNESTDIGFFDIPEKIYDSGYLLGCLTNHTSFFLMMDDLEFPRDKWMLLDMNKKTIVLQIKAYDERSAKPLVNLLKQIKSSARMNNWSGVIKVYRTVHILGV